nr:cell cycle control protein 50A-like [Lytechinus pictus]
MADIETIDTVQSTENDVHQRPKTSKSIILEERDEEEKVSKKPGNTAFKQQRLPAWQPILTAGTVLPMFFLVGIVFVPLGVGFLVTSNNVQEVILDYTRACTYLNETNGTNTCIDFYTYPENENSSCTCTMKFELNTKIEGPIYMYYRLTNYYQNHRRYVNSRDDIQLLGKNPLSASSDCSPYDQELRIYSNTSQERITYAPCGAIANSLFNDTFNITFDDDGELPSGKEVMLDRTNIAWSSDRRTKFRNPPGELEEVDLSFKSQVDLGILDGNSASDQASRSASETRRTHPKGYSLPLYGHAEMIKNVSKAGGSCKEVMAAGIVRPCLKMVIEMYNDENQSCQSAERIWVHYFAEENTLWHDDWDSNPELNHFTPSESRVRTCMD